MTRTKDHTITYQNQSHLVHKMFQDRNIIPTFKDLCLATDLMTRFCLEGYTKELSELFDRFEKYLDKEYKNN